MSRGANVAALFVETNGVYFGLPDVDPEHLRRELRFYIEQQKRGGSI